MIDHRVTDLSYGHFGEVTYEVESNEWCFSVHPSTQQITELLPLKTSIPPSISTFPSALFPSKQRTTSTRLLLKSRPEAYPAKSLLLSDVYSQAPTHSGPHVGNLLAIGHAVDVDRTLGLRKTKIIATACGEAGHVLRLIRPRLDRNEWGRPSSVRVSTLDVASSDQGFWLGTGGRILQIACADDQYFPTARLAVRQANLTTIFRPIYEASLTPAVVSSGYTKTYPPSRVNANPVAVLTVDQLGSQYHADVTWNPWYSRQFAVVDDLGSWSIFDVEGGVKKKISARLIAGRTGNIYDGFIPDPALKTPNSADGWHQILWVATVSTIVVCNRRHLAMFEIKSAPVRIRIEDFFSARNSDWILDLKRSPSNPSHLFILTSSRIFWLEVTPAGDEKDGGVRTLISYRHFRDANDGSMKLAIPRREDVMNSYVKSVTSMTKAVSVTIFSEKTSMLNIYTFCSGSDGLNPTASQAFLSLSSHVNSKERGVEYRLQSLILMDTPAKSIPKRPPSLEHQYIDKDVIFYQLLAVAPDLSVHSGLCAMYPSSANLLEVTPPTRSYSYTSGQMSSRRVVDDTWIIPDDHVDDVSNPAESSSHFQKRPSPVWKPKNDPRFTINFRSIFEYAFNTSDSGHGSGSLTTALNLILDRIKQAEVKDELSMATLLDILQNPEFAEDLEQAATILRDFLRSLQDVQELEGPSSLVLSNLTQCPGSIFNNREGPSLPDLSQVYDQVAENWITSLPVRVSGLTRLAKFKIARKLAIELYLSSIGVSVPDRASVVPKFPVLDGNEPADLHQILRVTSREGSPAFRSSQLPSYSLPDPGFGLPTPEQTPSLYSHSLASGSDVVEDPAISRLRQYTNLIKSKPNLRPSKILSHWPIVPGVDPMSYSYEATQKEAAADESGEERDHWRKREQARRRKRTERFIQRQSAAPPEASSQSQSRLAPSGSQPSAAQLGFSSQTFDDVPMTQPDRGAFGSRISHSKSKPKKKKAAGFR